MKTLFVVLFALTFSITSFAAAPRKSYSPEEQDWMASQNKNQRLYEKYLGPLFDDPVNSLTHGVLQNTTALPVAEYDKSKYLIFSSGYDFNSYQAKRTMAKNLPEDMTLVVYTWSDSEEHLQEIRDSFSDVIANDRLKVIFLPRAHRGFWSRDGVPVPVVRSNDDGESFFTVVDAKYYHTFEADDEVAEHFSAKITKHSYYYEGGNFMANSKGDCLVVNKPQTAQIPDSIFETHYGCKKLLRFPFVKGIGHADESLKFVSDNVVLTDEESYVSKLEDEGYTVKKLPRPNNPYETYVNSLIVNGVVYVPIFGQSTDEAALDVYRDLGFTQVIGINTVSLSNNGAGSLHCITMTYPDVPFQELIEALQ